MVGALALSHSVHITLVAESAAAMCIGVRSLAVFVFLFPHRYFQASIFPGQDSVELLCLLDWVLLLNPFACNVRLMFAESFVYSSFFFVCPCVGHYNAVQV